MACGGVDFSSDLASEKLAESLSSFVSVDEDASSICEMDAGNSNVIDGFFCCKNKLKWVGSLEDLKAFVLAEVDEDVIKSTTWRSPSGDTWKFEKMLSVTWQTKTQNIYFEGEKSKDVTTRIISFLKQSEYASEHTSLNTQCSKGEDIETELRIVLPISNSCCIQT